MRRRIIDNVPPQERRPRDQARAGRAARHRVRGAAAAARARPRRRVAALAVHAGRAAGAGRRRLRRAGRRRGAGRRRTGSCAPSSTGCSCSGCGAPTPCPTDPARAALARARAGLPGRRRGGDAVEASAPPGSPTPRRCAGCTRSCVYRPLVEAVARVPSEALRLTPDGGPGTGWRSSASPTRPARCATSRRSPAGCPGTRRSSTPCCRCCSSEFADAPEPDRGLLGLPAGLRRARRHARGTCGCCATRARWRCGWPGCSGCPGTSTDLLVRDPEALRLLADDAELVPRTAAVPCGRVHRRGGRHGTSEAGWRGGPGPRCRRSGRCAAGSCSGSPAPTCSAGAAGLAPAAPLDVGRGRPGAGRRHRRHARRGAARPRVAGRRRRPAVRHHRHGPARRARR